MNPEKLQALQSEIGKKVAIAHFYTGWQNLGNASIIGTLQTIQQNGWRPMISINPNLTDTCQANGKTLYKAIAAGNCDTLLTSIGQNLGQYGSPVLIRFAWEMNIDTMQWSIQKTGDTPADFIQAWRRFHTIVTSTGAKNVQWVFAPNTITAQSIPYNQIYPGDSYVDWVALDGYNWGTSQSWTNWQSFATIFSQSYNSLTALAPSKPLMISEVNTTDVGGDKAAWYQDMLAKQLVYNFPSIKAVVFYNEDRTAQEHVNWLIDSSPVYLQAFSQAIKNPIYLSSF